MKFLKTGLGLNVVLTSQIYKPDKKGNVLGEWKQKAAFLVFRIFIEAKIVDQLWHEFD